MENVKLGEFSSILYFPFSTIFPLIIFQQIFFLKKWKCSSTFIFNLTFQLKKKKENAFINTFFQNDHLNETLNILFNIFFVSILKSI